MSIICLLRRLAIVFVILGAALGPASAVAPDEILDDPVLEERARALSANLRCMVCQNQSIDDSDAPLAKDLRVLVRERLVAGDTDTQVIDYLVSRYGEFVLLKPRFAFHTLILWATAPLALLAGAIAIFVLIRRKRPTAASAASAPPLTDEEQARLDKLLKDDSKD